MGTTKSVALLCLVAAVASLAVAPLAADARTPRSLHMREPPDDPPAPPDAGSNAPASDAPAAPPSDAPPAAPSDAAPADAAPPAPAPAAPPPPATPAAPPDPAPPAAPVTEDGKTEVISVTDTPIEQKLFTGRAPVTVVTRTDLTSSGRATLGDILQSLPSQSNAGNAQVNAGGDGATRINLRGLGAPRTLVLLNGRRIAYGGNGADSAVDINAIPLAMIERVEILKDGASAMYGADAVGGVVNLITRPQFGGADFSLLTSSSQRGDGFEYDASAVTGFTTSDRHTYLVVSGGYQHHDPVFAGDRGFSRFQRSYDFATRSETKIASLAAPGGRIDVSSLGPGGMRPPGCAGDACKPVAGGFADFTSGDLYNEAASNYLYTPSTRYNFFATAGNRLTDDSHLILEVLYLHRNSSRELSPVPFEANTVISKDSIYNPLGGDITDYRRRVTELGPRQYLDTVSMIQFVVGMEGNVPASLGILDGWKYSLSQDYGSTESLVGTTGQLLLPRLSDATGPSMVYKGVPICVKTPGDPTTEIIYTVVNPVGGIASVRCVPLNLLAPGGTIPADQLKNITFGDAGHGTDSMHTTLFTANGKVAELPNHGDISLSLGGDYRDEVGDLAPPDVASAGYTTDNEVHATHGRYHIFEGFGELSVVPISGHEIARWLELDLGARVLDHSRFGSSLTYKAGGLFRTVHGLSLRGTYATAFRAPTVADLFSGQTERLPTAEDPCDTRPPSVGDRTRTLDPGVQAQCTAQGVPVGSRFTSSQQPSVTGGNPMLAPETAATTTLGVVYEPPRLKGLAATADYWRVKIDNAIETLGVQTIFANCYDRGIEAFCAQIRRDQTTHRITRVDQFLQNVIRTATSGIDLALRYDTRLAEHGRLSSGLEAQYLLSYDLATALQVIHGAGYYDLGVYPRIRANLSSHWIHPSGYSAGFTLRYVGSYQECAGNNCNDPQNLAGAHDVGRYAKLDVFGGYDFRSRAGRTTLQLGINNALDATPPTVYNAPAANSDATTYDFVGRLVYLRLSQLF